MIAGGQRGCLQHPPLAAAKCAAIAIREYNQAIFARDRNTPIFYTTVIKPTLDTFDAMSKHPLGEIALRDWRTGRFAGAAMKTGKRAVVPVRKSSGRCGRNGRSRSRRSLDHPGRILRQQSFVHR